MARSNPFTASGFSCGELLRHHDGVAVEIDAVIAHQQHDDVFRRNAARFEIDVGRHGEAEHRVDLALRQHGFAHRKSDILELHGGIVDLVDRLEDRPLGKCGIARGRTECLALEARQIGRDPTAFTPDDRERRTVVEDHHGLDVRAGIFIAKSHQRIHVAQTRIVGAGGDAGDRLSRTCRRIDGDIEAFGLEIPFFEGNRERSCRALPAPVEAEANRNLSVRRNDAEPKGR